MSTPSAVLLSKSNNNKRSVWFWQLDSNPGDGNERKEWTRYSDFESEFIEEAFQRMDAEVQLNDYIINFKHSIQLNIDDRNRQRSVRREEIDLVQYVREERFSYPQRAIKSFESEAKEENSFFHKWLSKNQQIKRDFSVIATLAGQGILEEGKLLHKEFDAQRMADQFRDCISKVKNLDCAARLYTAQSFLYELVNSSLRNNDMSKVDTLGPFCYLLYHRLRLDRVRGNRILYRGMNLTVEMVNEYKQAVGKEIVWPAFTSTSKDRRVAELYSGNTLFIIFSKDIWRPQNDISKLSYYPVEQEVLLSPLYTFTVDRLELESPNRKHLIYMTTSNT